MSPSNTHIADRYASPKRRVVAALQHCPSGLSGPALATLAYGSTEPAALHALHGTIWRLRRIADVAWQPIPTPRGFERGTYHWRGFHDEVTA